MPQHSSSLADEGVDRAVVERLRDDGHDVLYVAELAPSIPDEEVLHQANDRGVDSRLRLARPEVRGGATASSARRARV